MSGSLYGLRNLTQDFSGRRVLNIPSLDIAAEGICGLLGPNGAGKTTLLKILAFLEPPGSGEIRFRGRAVPPAEAACLRPTVVLVPQFPVMFTGSLRWNIEFPMRIRRIEQGKRRKKALDLLERVGLARLAEAPAHRLSGGECRRAAVARALAANPEVLLFDEPTAGVDLSARDELIELIRGVHAESGLSVILTTHEPETAARLCDRYIHLEQGKIVRRTLLSDGAAALPARILAPNRLAVPEADPSPAGRRLVFGLRRETAGLVIQTQRADDAVGSSLNLLIEHPDAALLGLRLGDMLEISVDKAPAF